MNIKKFFALCTLVLSTVVFCELHGASNAHAASTAVKIRTNMGDIIVRLDGAKAPETVKNFLHYVNRGHYNGTIFHRVIKDFMIQGGGMDANLNPKPTDPPIKNEAANGLDNDKYTIAMARTSNPHSATAQFFINTKNNAALNYTAPTAQGWGYTVFGKVIKGQNIVDKIEKVKTTSRFGHDDVPVDNVIIEEISVVQ